MGDWSRRQTSRVKPTGAPSPRISNLSFTSAQWDLEFEGVNRPLSFKVSLRWVRIISALLVVGIAKSYADVSPGKFIGSGIAARSDSDVRMEHAKVEIAWGLPGTVTATFSMVNPTSSPQLVTVGFPMPRGEVPGASAPDPLTITFDGTAASITPPGDRPRDSDNRRDWAWHQCNHTFKPGTTEVVVKTVLRPSEVHATPLQESFFYCIETARNWAGRIGVEEVTIKFPSPILDGQITGASPEEFQIQGNEVRWRMVNIEPRGDEYDIALTYVRPEAMQFIGSLREAVAKNPESLPARIKLAKHLLALGNVKSNTGFPPLELSLLEHATIAGRIKSKKQRKVFLSHYWRPANNRFHAAHVAWTTERLEVVQILADVGYRDEYSQAPFILEAEQLLQGVLKRDPHHAEAWNVYLASYWRYSFAAIGHWFGITRLGEPQAAIIDFAARNCPRDETIQLWAQFRKSKPEARNTDKLFEAIERNGYRRLEFP
jgi:hypothetical protein